MRFCAHGMDPPKMRNGLNTNKPRVESQDLFRFRIAQRNDYHFASNMNQLAQLAKGEILVLLNDDLILDKGSLDHAINILMNHEKLALSARTLEHRLAISPMPASSLIKTSQHIIALGPMILENY